MRRIAPALCATTSLGLSLLVATGEASGEPAAERVTCHGRVATLVGTTGDDQLVGTKKADVIVGLNGDDDIRDRGGDDVVCGGPGNDWLGGQFGGAGDDKLYGGKGRDAIDAGLGRNLVWAGAGNDSMGSNWWRWGHNKSWGGPGNDAFYTVSVHEAVHGGPGDDSIEASVRPGASAVLRGGGGANELQLYLRRSPSGQRWHHIRVDLRQDRIVADGVETPLSGLFSTLYLYAGTAELETTLVGTRYDDHLLSFIGGGDVVEHGLDGDDLLYTRGGDDTLDGGLGTDQGHAGRGQDTCLSIEGPVVGSPNDESDPIGCETSLP